MEDMEDKVIEKTAEAIERIMKEGIATTNIDNLFKLSKIKHLAKEDKEMYGNYNGRGPSRGAYGEYGNYGDNYGRRGVDSKYRGYDHLGTMYNEYGRYEEGKNYGDKNETDRSYHYMVKALEDFIRVLYEEAETEQQKQQLRETLQRSMM